MNVTDVKIKLIVPGATERLRGFAVITLDTSFVIRDIKIIDGPAGLFVAMPSRKIMSRCTCGTKNALGTKFCNNCGQILADTLPRPDQSGRPKLYCDIAHPITVTCRQQIQEAIIKAYQLELTASKQPDYRPHNIDAEV